MKIKGMQNEAVMLETIQNEEGEKDEAINLFDVALSIIGVTRNSFLGGMFILLVCDQHGPQPI